MVATGATVRTGLRAVPRQRRSPRHLPTSHRYLSHEAIRLLARHTIAIATRPDQASALTAEDERWMRRLGALVPIAPVLRATRPSTPLVATS